MVDGVYQVQYHVLTYLDTQREPGPECLVIVWHCDYCHVVYTPMQVISMLGTMSCIAAFGALTQSDISLVCGSLTVTKKELNGGDEPEIIKIGKTGKMEDHAHLWGTFVNTLSKLLVLYAVQK